MHRGFCPPLGLYRFLQLLAYGVPIACLALMTGCGPSGGSGDKTSRDTTIQDSIPESQPSDAGTSEIDLVNGEPQTSNRNTDSGSVEPASSPPPPTAVSRKAILERVDRHLSLGELPQAKELLRQLLVQKPTDYEIMFRLAKAEADSGNLEIGIELLGEIPPGTPQAGIAALGVGADWAMQLQRFDDAAQRYEAILKIAPSINQAKRRLAYLRNRQGKRHEAVRLIRELCAAGDVMQDELHALIVESDAMFDSPDQAVKPGSRPYWPIGSVALARQLFTQKKYFEAATLLAPEMQKGSADESTIAFFGRLAVESQDENLIATWQKSVNEDSARYPEHWAALGTLLVRDAKFASAARALAEAVRLDPTDLRSVRRLFQSLRSLGRDEEAELWIERYALLNRILASSNAIASETVLTPKSYLSLAADLKKAGRNLEAVLWESVLASKQSDRPQLQALRAEMGQILKSGTAYPSPAIRWCGMDFSVTALPDLSQLGYLKDLGAIAGVPDLQRQRGKSFHAVFADVSADIRLLHRYKIAKKPEPDGFAIYQAYGGAVAVLDYDQNGTPDLYFAQGDADPPDFLSVSSDVLYRNQREAGSYRLKDTTESAGLVEDAYTVGVTAGDWNQDGFQDLAVTNIGVNYLMINRGDGTFSRAPLDESPDLFQFSTSLAMADVSGDSLPDLITLNYLRDPQITRLPERDEAGKVINAVSPKSFLPVRDDIYQNTKDGNFLRSELGIRQQDSCTGLGIIVTDLREDFPGNEIFVGNDVMKNQLWVRDSKAVWSDIAAVSGCAYGSLGASTGSMGIAAADLDQNGYVDLHVSNYTNEPSSLFLSDGEIYRDLNVKWGLASDTTPLVGFGSQPCDFNHDGLVDLLITNGHVDDLESHGEPFRQLTQLFANDGVGFRLVNVTGSEYWSKPHLGRGLATLDFNQDGKMDFVATDLLDRSSLLINKTPSDNNWITFRLVGRSSERDAIGAKVQIQSATSSWRAWAVAGDGYLAKNESVIHLGIGAITNLEEAAITWPSGTIQHIDLSGLDVNHRYLVIENESSVWRQR